VCVHIYQREETKNVSDPGLDPAAAGAAPTDDAAATPPTDDTAPPTDEEAPPTDDKTTIATICYSKSANEFTLYNGDEPEEGDEGTPPASGDMSGASAEPTDEGQKFSSPGPLLKAVLDLVKTAEAGGSEEDQFGAGFNESSEPTLKAG
jgi:hypothetical protein